MKIRAPPTILSKTTFFSLQKRNLIEERNKRRWRGKVAGFVPGSGYREIKQSKFSVIAIPSLSSICLRRG
jgi:hypothetical protein